jgi:hypothetical protein
LAVFTEDLADGSYVAVAAPVTPKPHHSAGRSHGFEAIAWYRSIVPAGETVVLTDETGGYVWPLGPGVTADDVEDFLSTGDPAHLTGQPA